MILIITLAQMYSSSFKTRCTWNPKTCTCNLYPVKWTKSQSYFANSRWRSFPFLFFSETHQNLLVLILLLHWWGCSVVSGLCGVLFFDGSKLNPSKVGRETVAHYVGSVHLDSSQGMCWDLFAGRRDEENANYKKFMSCHCNKPAWYLNDT